METFDIVFTKLGELQAEDELTYEPAPAEAAVDELEELRRFVASIDEPSPSSFTIC